MRLDTQVRNFVRVLFNGAPSISSRYRDPLAKTAGHLKVVNMSVEDDRLASRGSNEQYVKSLE
ncbi:MAG: hypothetical protein ACRBK7_31765 [Acidimicrobiales bacterium]